MNVRSGLTDAAGGVFVRALGVGPELAVLVAAGVGVLGAQQAGVALLVTFHAEVAAERLLRFREAAARLGQQDLEIISNIFHYFFSGNTFSGRQMD